MPADDDVADLWREAKPLVLARCAAVRHAAVTGDAETFATARHESHKLAGAIGMYGLVEASALAIRLDDLVVGGALDDGRRATVVALVDELERALAEDR